MNRREFFASFGLLQRPTPRVQPRSDARIALDGFRAQLQLAITTDDFTGGLLDVLEKLTAAVDRLEGRTIR